MDKGCAIDRTRGETCTNGIYDFLPCTCIPFFFGLESLKVSVGFLIINLLCVIYGEHSIECDLCQCLLQERVSCERNKVSDG